jgi:hypothetical protein
MNSRAGIYRHFKGGRYQVFGDVWHTEDGEWLVHYMPLYGEHEGKHCARPKAMFHEHVDKPNYSGPRFVFEEEVDQK